MRLIMDDEVIVTGKCGRCGKTNEWIEGGRTINWCTACRGRIAYHIIKKTGGG